MSDCPEIQGQKLKGDEFTISYKNPDIRIEHEGSFFHAKHNVWLPRQDQIQEMLRLGRHVYLETMEFYRAVCGGSCSYLPRAESFEQLWLKFYMYEKHKKKWNGKRWK